MRIVALSGAQSLVHPVFGAAKAGADGVFDLPAEFAAELVKQRGQFVTEGEHLANQVKASLEDFADPHKIPHALHGLRERIAAIEAHLGIGEVSGAVATDTPADALHAVAEVKKLTARQAKAKAKADAAAAAAAPVTEPPAGTPLTDGSDAEGPADPTGDATPDAETTGDVVEDAADPTA